MNKKSEDKSLPDVDLSEQKIVADYSHIETLENGNFQESQNMVDFWSDAQTDTYAHTHLRVSQLQAKLTYQYKFHDGQVYLRTLQYIITTRPSGTYWYRANIDVALVGANSVLKYSPDAMWQDNQWHSYVVELVARDVSPGSFFPAMVRVGVEYDGTNNGVGEKDHWGPLRALNK